MLDTYLQQLQNGDQQAFEKIYFDTKNYVFAVCFALVGNHHTAEDMMQDTFLRIRKYILYYKPRSNARAWIAQIAKNTCLNEIKSAKRVVATDFDENPSVLPTCTIKISDESGVFETARNALNPTEYKIVVLHLVGKLRLKEIAQLIQKPQGTIRWLYKQALDKLKKKLAKEVSREE